MPTPNAIYCSALGSDTTGNGSEAAPYRTPTYALRPPSQGGPDWAGPITLYLRSGDSFPHLEYNRSGLNPELPFTITSYGQGPKPILSSINCQNGSRGINHTVVHNVAITKTTDSLPNGLMINAVGEGNIIDSVDVTGAFNNSIVIQSPEDVGPSQIFDTQVVNNKLTGSLASACYFAAVDRFKASGNIITNAGRSMFDQGFYFNANCTNYEVSFNYLDRIANCAIQARSGRMNVHDNVVLRSGYGVATGHGMSRTPGLGAIQNNAVLLGSALGPNPLSCGIGVCMVQEDAGNPFDVSGNIVMDSMDVGQLGGISFGDDNATEYTYMGGPVRGSGPCTIAGNFVRNWGPALRLCENKPGLHGITRNQFFTTNQTTPLLRLLNSTRWNNLGVRPFADYLSTGKILQQNDWAAPDDAHLLQLEEAAFNALITLPSNLLPGLDPGCSIYPSHYTPDVSIASFLQTTATPTQQAEADELTRRLKSGSTTVLNFLTHLRNGVGY